ncbi:MAG TPA: hypothetical protein V6D19_05320 [Stenomitos sp.]
MPESIGYNPQDSIDKQAMNKAKLVDAIAERANVTKTEADNIG